MSAGLKKKIIAAFFITIILALLYHQSAEREKAMTDFIKMQQAPIKEAEKKQSN